MKPIKKTVRFSIQEDGEIRSAITQELVLEWHGVQWKCYNSDTGDHAWTGKGPSQTVAILDWLADRLGAR